MRILMVTSEFYPESGGLGLAVEQLCRVLQETCGVEVIVAVCGTWRDPVSRRTEWFGMPVHRIKFTGLPIERPLRQTLRTAYAFSALLLLRMRYRVDAIHSHGVHDLGLLSGLIGKLTNVATITTAHGPSDLQYQRLDAPRARFLRMALALSDGVVCISSYVEFRYHRMFPGMRTCLAPNITPAISTTMRHHPERTLQPFRIAMVGRIVREHGEEIKGFSYAIEAAGSMTGIQLEIFGDGPDRGSLENAVRSIGVADRVRFRGPIPHDALLEELCRMHVLLHPSLVESYGLVVAEAMAIGLPVIATTTDGLADLIRDRDTALVIRERDSGDIVRACDEARRDYQAMCRYAERAKSWLAAFAAPSDIAKRIHGFYESCTTGTLG